MLIHQGHAAGKFTLGGGTLCDRCIADFKENQLLWIYSRGFCTRHAPSPQLEMEGPEEEVAIGCSTGRRHCPSRRWAGGRKLRGDKTPKLLESSEIAREPRTGPGGGYSKAATGESITGFSKRRRLWLWVRPRCSAIRSYQGQV